VKERFSIAAMLIRTLSSENTPIYARLPVRRRPQREFLVSGLRSYGR